MRSMRETAEQFLDACESGKGWDGCREHCHEGATFSAQADALADISSLEGYTEWMKGLLQLLPDGAYELRSLGIDEERRTVTAFAVFRGTHTGEGGPVPPTHQQVRSEYVYVLELDGDRLRHMTKVWNDAQAMRQLGWS